MSIHCPMDQSGETFLHLILEVVTSEYCLSVSQCLILQNMSMYISVHVTTFLLSELPIKPFSFCYFLTELYDGKIEQVDKKLVIDKETKQSTQERLFDFIAQCVAEFIKEKKLTKKLPLGFTFSFPVHQTSLTSGTLIRWTKDFSASGAEGQDVVKLLKQAFERRGVSVELCILLYCTWSIPEHNDCIVDWYVQLNIAHIQ